MEQHRPKKIFYNKERYEKNKDEILTNRREKYRTQHNKDLVNIKVCKGSFTLYFDQIFFLYIIYIMYVLIGKERCNQCNRLKNLLDEKGIQHTCVDVSKIPHELLTQLRMYSNTYPIVLGIKHFSTFNETLEYFNDI